jgi:hypothetical protein
VNYGLRHFGNDVMQLSATRIWRDFGSALPFQTRVTQTKPVLPLSNEHGSQVKDQGRRQCCHNKHKHFPIGLHVMRLYFPTRLVKERLSQACIPCHGLHNLQSRVCIALRRSREVWCWKDTICHKKVSHSPQASSNTLSTPI